ncbi:MAG: hypothetical protein ABEJ43_06715 [Haloferacaceae archaeon]
MDVERSAATAGVVGCLATLAAMGAPYALIAEPGTGLPIYYGAGPLGASPVAFLAVLQPIVLLSGTRGRADPQTVAGIALVVGLSMLGIAVSWALAVPRGFVLSFPAAWMGWHRWAVVALVALVSAASGTYTRAALR